MQIYIKDYIKHIHTENNQKWTKIAHRSFMTSTLTNTNNYPCMTLYFFLSFFIFRLSNINEW